jgi:diaminopimelate epimerase
MRIEFAKMHALGNDFIVFEQPPDAPLPSSEQWRALSDRHTGIGFDQALVLLPPRRGGSDTFYRVFNADGGEVEQCGNGVRCFAAFRAARGRAPRRELALDSLGGLVHARLLDGGNVAVDVGIPNFDPQSLPFEAEAPSDRYRIEIGNETIELSAVSIGNPHAVLLVPSVDTAPVERIGGALQSHARFPRRVNVGFMQLIDRGHVRLRVYERGVGETRACGTGACAAAVIGRHLGLLDAIVEVRVPGGVLGVHWSGAGESVWLTGPAQFSFDGCVEI